MSNSAGHMCLCRSRFGWLGLNEDIPPQEILNYIGVVLCLIRYFCALIIVVIIINNNNHHHYISNLFHFSQCFFLMHSFTQNGLFYFKGVHFLRARASIAIAHIGYANSVCLFVHLVCHVLVPIRAQVR